MKDLANMADANDHRLYEEAHFHSLISTERKRRERSRQPLLLMVLDVTRLATHEVTRIAATLVSATRETDIKGWFWDGSALGVLFCELGAERDWVSARDAIQRKLHIALASDLTGAFSWHLIPPASEDLAAVRQQRTQTNERLGSSSKAPTVMRSDKFEFSNAHV
jgi:hypothetical protein